jgi:PAS domain S-box-containing protein
MRFLSVIRKALAGGAAAPGTPGAGKTDLRRMTWALRAYTQSAGALPLAATPEAIMRSVCEAIVTDEPYILAWVGLVEQGEGLPVRITAAAGPARAYADGLALSWSADRPEGRGPTGLALRSGQPQIMRDALTDPVFAAWRERGNRYGIRSSITVPFSAGGTVMGALAVYASSPDAFGEAEITVFQRLGNDVAAGIVERRQRTRLAIAESRLQRLISGTYTPIVSIDAAGTITLFNEAAERVFGYSRAEAIGRPLDLLIPDDTAARHRSYIADFHTLHDARPMAPGRELWGRRKNGEKFPIEVSISGIDTEDGVLLTAVIHDMSEQRALQARLVQSEKMNAFGQLAGGIAHDFNNLLAVIAANCDILQTELPAGTPAAQHVQRIQSTCASGSELVRQLLAFARRSGPAARTVDVAGLVGNMVPILRHTLGRRIQLEFTGEAGRCFAAIDPSVLDTAILNLALNARDAMPDGGLIALSVTAEAGHIAVRVRDTGTGMAPDVLSQVFEPFFTTKAAGAGTGLGLAMVQGAVQQAGGRVEVESTPGAGTCFTLVLPAAPPPAAAPRPAGKPRLTFPGRTALIVEDDADLQLSMRIQFERLGFTVLTARSAAEAREQLAAPRIDLLFTDLNLRSGDGADGIDIATAFSRAHPQSRVILTTGYLEVPEPRRIDGAWRVLTKPVPAGDLVTTLGELLEPAAP